MKQKIEVVNKKAKHLYTFIDVYIAGFKIVGSEVKSIRNYGISFHDSYCMFQEKHLVVKNLHISEYKDATYNNHTPKRDKIILLRKHELRKLKKGIEQKGMTIIPIKLFENEKGVFKLQIALCKGKKNFDKRETLRNKDIQRDLEQK